MCFQAYNNCLLCPRKCGVNRSAGHTGYCDETATLRIASIGPHFGEEPSFSGTRGSGTLFFTGCSTRCFFCQNYQISQEGLGEVYTVEACIDSCRKLVAQGVHNLNFVTPDHFWPHIQVICTRLREEGVDLPFLLNGSGYHRPELIEDYARQIDIFMPDFKFADATLAAHCMNDANYPTIALEALRKMISLKGFLFPWDPSGKDPAQKGVLVRHLIMPGYVENSLSVLRLLHQEFGPDLPLSIMSQFHPVPACEKHRDCTRKLNATEFNAVYELAVELEFTHAYIQDIPEDDQFLPDFSKESPFAGNA